MSDLERVAGLVSTFHVEGSGANVLFTVGLKLSSFVERTRKRREELDVLLTGI